MDSGNNFDQSFMQNVKDDVTQAQERAIEEKKAAKRRIIIVAAVMIASAVILAIIGTVILLSRSNEQTPAEETPYEETTEEGSAREYGGDEDESGGEGDDDGDLVAIRMGCSDKNKLYDFYKDNTYEIMDLGTDETVEVGSYTIKGKTFTLETEGAERTITYDGKKIIDGESSYACEEYENV